MVVEPRKKDGDTPPQSRKALVVSLVLHLAVFLLVIFGLPHWKDDPIISDPVPVELIANVGELTTTNKPKVDAPKPEKPKEEPPKKVEEKPKPPEPKKSTPPEPSEEDLKDPPKPEKVEKKTDDKAEKKVEKKPEPKKRPPKKEEQADFDSLLKDLAPEEKQQPDTDATDKKMTEPTPTPNVSKFSDVLSISEMDALRQQLSQCWSVMAGAQNAEDQIVELNVVVNQDRTVASAQVADQSKYNSNPSFRAAADSAMRAMRNPNCSPLNVPPEKYNQWHEMTIVFDPKEMF